MSKEILHECLSDVAIATDVLKAFCQCIHRITNDNIIDIRYVKLYHVGGGVLDMRVTSSLRLEGVIRASGEASTTASGGGSGGSIQIHTYEMEGSGSVQVSFVASYDLFTSTGDFQLK